MGNFFFPASRNVDHSFVANSKVENASTRSEWLPAKANAEQLSARQVEGTADTGRDLPAAQATLLCILKRAYFVQIL